MNEEELQDLVARARDVEGSSQPPPGLVERARRSAHHRRRVAGVSAAVAVAAVIAAGVVVPGMLRHESSPEPGRLAVADTGELSDHGGPCPLVLPSSTNGDEFGTSAPAQDEPTFAAPDTAWVCQYQVDSIGRTASDSTKFEWSLTNAPRRIEEAALPQVVQAQRGVRIDDAAPGGCTGELGPRWALVTSAGGDLTGVVVDDYGCRDVRLTDDPFLTAPGDPQAGGTVPGVLVAPGLADTLEAWWDSSPADIEPGPTPQKLHVTCTDAGPQVDTTAVTATPAGVVLIVDSTMSPGSYLTYTSDGPSGGDNLRQIPNPATYEFPPGEVDLGCASPPGMDETGNVTVSVEDPNGYWRTSTLADFGCQPGGAQPSWVVFDASGATPQEAVEDLLAQFAEAVGASDRAYTAESAPTGYSGSATQTRMGYRRGTAHFSITVTNSGTSYAAYPDVLCGPR